MGKSFKQQSMGIAPWATAGTLICVAVDFLHWIFFDSLNALFREALATPGKASVQLVVALCVAQAVSFWLIARLHPDVPLKVVEWTSRNEDTGLMEKFRSNWPQIIFFVPTCGFLLLMCMAGIEVAGKLSFGDTKGTLSESWQNLALVGPMGIFFVGFIIHGVFFQEPRYRSHEARYLLYLVPAVLISEVMLNFSAALWVHFLGSGAGPAAAGASMGGAMLVGLPLFWLLFAAPRFTLMSKNFTWLTLSSAMALTVHEFWRLLKDHPI